MFTSHDEAREALTAAAEYLIYTDGYSLDQIIDLLETMFGEDD